MDTVLKAFGGSGVALLVAYLLLRTFDTNVSALFKLVSEKGLEEFKSSLAREFHSWQKESESEQLYRSLQQPVLTEAIRVVMRLHEVLLGKFPEHYDSSWSAKSLNPVNLETNKRDTATYRLLKFLAGYQLYIFSTAGSPPHSLHSNFEWYFEKKITPVLASGGYPDIPVMWRDTLIELGESMIVYSEKWKALRTLSWSQFCVLLNESRDPFLEEQARRVAVFLNGPSVRLALLAVYLIDMNQDILITRGFERLRNDFVKYLYEHRGDSHGFSVYGKTEDGLNDIKVTDVDAEKVPRNIRSFLFAEAQTAQININYGAANST